MEEMDNLASMELNDPDVMDYDIHHVGEDGTDYKISSHSFEYYSKVVYLDNTTVWFYGDQISKISFI